MHSHQLPNIFSLKIEIQISSGFIQCYKTFCLMIPSTLQGDICVQWCSYLSSFVLKTLHFRGVQTVQRTCAVIVIHRLLYCLIIILLMLVTGHINKMDTCHSICLPKVCTNATLLVGARWIFDCISRMC